MDDHRLSFHCSIPTFTPMAITHISLELLGYNLPVICFCLASMAVTNINQRGNYILSVVRSKGIAVDHHL